VTEAKRGTLPVLLGVVFINLVGFGVVIPLLPFFAGSFGADPWQITLLFSAYSLGNVFGEPFWGRLSDRIGRRPVLLLTIGGNALTYIALAYAPSIWAACAVRLCGGFLTGNVSTIQGYIADITPPERRPARLGLLGAAFGVGFLVGPVLGGLAAMPGMGMMGYPPAPAGRERLLRAVRPGRRLARTREPRPPSPSRPPPRAASPTSAPGSTTRCSAASSPSPSSPPPASRPWSPSSASGPWTCSAGARARSAAPSSSSASPPAPATPFWPAPSPSGQGRAGCSSRA
jgi:MFS family permease